jgi:hypothetical protein
MYILIILLDLYILSSITSKGKNDIVFNKINGDFIYLAGSIVVFYNP